MFILMDSECVAAYAMDDNCFVSGAPWNQKNLLKVWTQIIVF